MGVIGAVSNQNPIANIGALIFLLGAFDGMTYVFRSMPEPKSTWNAKAEVKKWLEKNNG